MSKLLLTKTEINNLCDSGNMSKQMEELTRYGIPFRVSHAGNLKVLRSDVRFAIENTRQEGPRYDAA